MASGAKNHPYTPKAFSLTREIRALLLPMSTPTGNMVYIYMSNTFIYPLKYTDETSNIAFTEDIMENNSVVVWLLVIGYSNNTFFSSPDHGVLSEQM